MWSTTTGARLRPFSVDGSLQAAQVTAGSNAAKAGLRNGDVIDLGALNMRDRFEFGSPGTAVRLKILRGDRTLYAVLHGAGTRRRLDAWQIALTIVADTAYFVLVILLLGKASQRLDARLMVYLLIALLVDSVAFRNLTPDGIASFLLTMVLQNGAAACIFYFLARFITHVPQRSSPHTRTFERLIPLFIGVNVLNMAYAALAVPFPQIDAVVFGVRLYTVMFWGSEVATLVFLVVIIGDGLTHTSPRERVQLQWIASTLSLLVGIELFRAVYYAIYFSFGGIPYLKWLDPVTLPFEDLALLGAAYAVLRHRLIDVGVIVSRTAIFTAVSAVLVIVFLVFEWLGTVVAERVLGDIGSAAAYSGIAAALIAGLLARPVHNTVERHLNTLFFRNQARNEEALRRFARESEVATDADRLMDSAFATLMKHVEGNFVAMLVREDAGFRCVYSSQPLMRKAIDENDPLALRLRRFGEPFELDEPGDEFHHAMFVPMTVLGRLVAFIVCGAKPDRTRYAERETDALSQFAQRVGTAYVLLRDKREFRIPAEMG
ncbi:MAG TPA: hypothetical protein VIO32_08325 [Candidatus Baltobacteraceae bacterium]